MPVTAMKQFQKMTYSSRLGEEILHGIEHVLFGGGIWLVDVFPFLQHLPSFLPAQSYELESYVRGVC